MKQTLLLSLGLALAFCASASAEGAPAGPAVMISNFRAQHGEGRVTLDPALNRIAQAQATAMASKDVLDHDVFDGEYLPGANNELHVSQLCRRVHGTLVRVATSSSRSRRTKPPTP